MKRLEHFIRMACIMRNEIGNVNISSIIAHMILAKVLINFLMGTNGINSLSCGIM